ncbi:MliC family protein [Psychrobacter jeotgali]|uniref:MliC family protein n=1 Tax=Psychrobacter jeotgali TaxID=179010 RepID=UPI00191B14BC|nr:MliC family protein [Psychrobacter jeotgali]
MKKLLAVAPFAVLLAACATNSPTTPTPNTNNQKVVQSFTCEDNGRINAEYAADGSAANLNVTLPKVGLNNQKMVLTQAVSGSGARYTNMSNPNTGFEWQTKADYGIMTIHMGANQQYSVNCNMS